MEHHPWCNFFTQPQEDCKQCKRLYEKYPIDGLTTNEEMMKKYFPHAKIRPTTEKKD